MNPDIVLFLTLATCIIAFLYSAVGHAGASGYIAVMTLAGLTPEVVKPTALTLNVLVASLAAWQFWRGGHFCWRLFWPFGASGIPMALIGGYFDLPVRVFGIVVGAVLLMSAARFVVRPAEVAAPHPPPVSFALATGGLLGLLAGLTGTGGGIFLTPLVILRKWARTQTASAISAVFILGNSLAGLVGNVGATRQLPDIVLPLAGAVVAGGAVGSYLGSRKLPHTAIQRLLSLVLTIAGVKLLLA